MGLLDTILQSYISALLGGFAVLHVYTLPIFGVVAHLAFLRGVMPTIRAGIHTGEIWAHLILLLVSLAGYIFLLTNFRMLTTLIFDLASTFGAQVGGLTGGALMTPSGVMEAGAFAMTPITEFTKRTTGWAALFNIGTLFQYYLIYDIVLFAFAGIALNISLTVIEWHFSVLAATVLLPWAPLGATAFLAEFVLGWVLGMTIRVFIQTALIGLSIPLFGTLVVELTSGGDPSFWGAFGVLLASILFFVLSWLIPNRAVGLLARGLAISGTDVLAGLSSAARGIRGFAGAGGAVVSGASRLLRQERA